MRKSFYTLAPAALLMMAAISPAHAAGKNATLTVTANVTAATCDVVLGSPALELGSFTATELATAMAPVNTQKVDVSLKNCSTPTTKNVANFIVTGATTASNSAVFNSVATSDVGALVKDGATIVKTGDKVLLKDFSAHPTMPTAAELGALNKSFDISLTSAIDNPKTKGSILAPITFQFDYN
ncbi:type 1 fimbrial protein [Enterobacter sp. Ap-916]|uniref:type 1 fimbrial protein n=1 Tax=Enterobacteriaceae TaxID=543 RepID=UPI00141E7C83|nr:MULTISPECIES: type 1 fimbrial protein [unclassified Enterobacter]NIF58006.1 type 1 fimbrial protein [Enterobacter sp. Ap-867]NIG28052.1 type 1 fimbrial protein [Enterobacter sp. Ap-916]